MSVRDDRITLRQMLDHARQAVGMASGRRRSDLDSDYMFQLALTRLVEIVGEAAARLSAPSRELYREIPWAAIVGMQNRLIHGYDVVDLDLLWNTIDVDLPPLIDQLETILGDAP